MQHRSFLPALALTLLACGSSNSGEPAPIPDAPIAIDAAPVGPDAPPGTQATEVDCAGVTPVAEIYFTGNMVTGGMPRITVGDVVKFRDLGAHTAWHEFGLWSASGDTPMCVRFDSPGEYRFDCYFDMGSPGEQGAVIVE